MASSRHSPLSWKGRSHSVKVVKSRHHQGFDGLVTADGIGIVLEENGCATEDNAFDRVMLKVREVYPEEFRRPFGTELVPPGMVMIKSGSHRSSSKVESALGFRPKGYYVSKENRSAGASYLLVPQEKTESLLKIKGVSKTRQDKEWQAFWK